MKEGLAGQVVDIILADVPYGLRSSWREPDDMAIGERTPMWKMLDALRPVLSEHTVVAIAWSTF